MRPFSTLLTASLLSLALAHIHTDTLTSRRALKRGLDQAGNYNISIFHLNDVHAHLDEFRSSGTDCADPSRGCFGGYARIKTVIDRERPTKDDALFLNAGDEFQGTLFYQFYGGEKIAETLNQLGFDAMTVGNHEFDAGDDVLGSFIQNLTFPVVSSNIHSTHPVLNATLVPYHLFPEHNLALVAATTETTPDISKPGKGTTFADPVSSLQSTVDWIYANTNTTRVVALTHIGFEKDVELAKKTRGIHLIVGGHSHTPLGKNIPNNQGDYPTIAENLEGEEVFVVTAYRWGEYLGYIDVAFAPDGSIAAYSGAPIHLTNSTAQDPELQAQIKEWRKPFEEFVAEVLGESNVDLVQSTCRTEECTLGNYMADAMLSYRQSVNPKVAGAIINAGGIRAEIDVGPITRGEVLTSFPFGNSIVELEFTGSELWEIVEGIVSGQNQVNMKPVTSFLQVSKGIKIEYNPAQPNGSRLVTFEIGGEEVAAEEKYTIVTLDFLAGGGDNFWEARTGAEVVVLDTQDEVLTRYIAETSPVEIEVEGRIVKTDKKGVEGPGGGVGGGNGTSGGNGTVVPQVPEGEGAGVRVGWSLGAVVGAVVAGLMSL